jgi:hypothetical protein
MQDPTPPINAAGATLGAATAAVPSLVAFGVNLGLRPDILVAGFAGALAAIVLLGSVPAEGDTWRHLLRTTWRRVGVALASSLVAGYLTPMVALAAPMAEPLTLGVAFAVGAGAQRVLRNAITRAASQAGQPGAGGQP